MRRLGFVIAFFLIFPSISIAEKDMVIKLPKPRLKGEVSLEETIKKRRSERSLSGKGLTLEQISQLLWSCQGVTNENGFRAAPSAGATYPLEIYLLTKDGLFQYLPKVHSIKRLKEGDLRSELSKACLGQGFIKDAAVDIMMCAEFERTTGRYRQRGENYVYIEVGHAAQNVHLQAVAEGLGSIAVGAFSDDEVKRVLDLPENFVPIYVISVGYIE